MSEIKDSKLTLNLKTVGKKMSLEHIINHHVMLGSIEDGVHDTHDWGVGQSIGVTKSEAPLS